MTSGGAPFPLGEAVQLSWYLMVTLSPDLIKGLANMVGNIPCRVAGSWP